MQCYETARGNEQIGRLLTAKGVVRNESNGSKATVRGAGVGTVKVRGVSRELRCSSGYEARRTSGNGEVKYQFAKPGQLNFSAG